MYGILFTYIWLILMVTVGEYTDHMDPMGSSLDSSNCDVVDFGSFLVDLFQKWKHDRKHFNRSVVLIIFEAVNCDC